MIRPRRVGSAVSPTHPSDLDAEEGSQRASYYLRPNSKNNANLGNRGAPVTSSFAVRYVSALHLMAWWAVAMAVVFLFARLYFNRFPPPQVYTSLLSHATEEGWSYSSNGASGLLAHIPGVPSFRDYLSHGDHPEEEIEELVIPTQVLDEEASIDQPPMPPDEDLEVEVTESASELITEKINVDSFLESEDVLAKHDSLGFHPNSVEEPPLIVDQGEEDVDDDNTPLSSSSIVDDTISALSNAIVEDSKEGEHGVHSEDLDTEEAEDASPQVGPGGVVGGPASGGTYDGRDVRLQPQILLPSNPVLQHYGEGKNYWPLHDILKARGWSIATSAQPSRVTMWISRGAIPPRLKKGYQMVNSMGVSGCIGGAKTLQLVCRRRLASLHGCDYESLGIQPPQYNMLDLEDCKRFFRDAERPGLESKLYLNKPSYTFHGAGIQVHKGPKDLRTEYGSCTRPKHAILMDYISDPATMMGGHKFDFRSYLLVASLNPQMVFYHDGFVRRSDKPYDANSKSLNVHITNKVTQSKEDHFFNFTALGASLHRELGLPRHHIEEYVRPKMQKVMRFLWNTARVQPNPPNHIPGRYHLFGIDWMLDRKGEVHLLEGNGYPLVTHYEGIDLTPKVWEEMTDLILAIHTKPESLGTKITVRDGFRFGGWRLVYNELEEMARSAQGRAYNACTAA